MKRLTAIALVTALALVAAGCGSKKSSTGSTTTNQAPSFKVGLTKTKSPSNPLGMKGCGEAGAIAAPAAVINAITDALGTEEIAMPATASAVWSVMQKTAPKAA